MAGEHCRDDEWLTVAEATALAGVSRQTIYVWMRRRWVLTVKIGGRQWVERAALDRLLQLRRRAAAAGVSLDTILHWVGRGEPPLGDDSAVGRVEEEEDTRAPRVRLAQAGDEGDQGGVVGEAEDLAERTDVGAGLEHHPVERSQRPP